MYLQPTINATITIWFICSFFLALDPLYTFNNTTLYAGHAYRMKSDLNNYWLDNKSKTNEKRKHIHIIPCTIHVEYGIKQNEILFMISRNFFLMFEIHYLLCVYNDMYTCHCHAYINNDAVSERRRRKNKQTNELIIITFCCPCSFVHSSCLLSHL